MATHPFFLRFPVLEDPLELDAPPVFRDFEKFLKMVALMALGKSGNQAAKSLAASNNHQTKVRDYLQKANRRHPNFHSSLTGELQTRWTYPLWALLVDNLLFRIELDAISGQLATFQELLKSNRESYELLPGDVAEEEINELLETSGLKSVQANYVERRKQGPVFVDLRRSRPLEEEIASAITSQT